MRSDFFQKPKTKFLILALIFMSALGVRLYHITAPPLDFAAVRQYQNAHNARAYFFRTQDNISDENKQIAETNMKRIEFKLEPRIIEGLAVYGYRIAGGEKLWIPRLLSSIFWIIGGIFFFLATRKITSRDFPAMFAALFYLFLPYSILASRSFQPDPMMIMFLMISFYTILHHHEHPSKYRLLAAACASAMAMFLKPYSVFMVFGLFIPLALKRKGFKKAILDPDILVFSFISVLPAFAFYTYSIFGTGDAALHAQITFLPHLYLRSYFWKDWLSMIGDVTGLLAFACALIGLLMSRGLLRIILTGLWIGYIIFGLIFTYHIHTHSYYQLQFIPVVALSLIPVADWSRNRLSGLLSSRISISVLIALSVLTAICSVYIIRNAPLRDYKGYLKPAGAVVGLNPDFYLFLTRNFKKELDAFTEIGEIVKHGTENVFLTYDYGRALTYHGALSGLPWPTKFSMLSREEMGVPIPPKEEIFNSRYLMIRTHKNSLFDTKKYYGDYIRYTPDYFIITSFEEFDAQPDLKEYLYGNFPLLSQSKSYLVFDLREMSE